MTICTANTVCPRGDKTGLLNPDCFVWFNTTVEIQLRFIADWLVYINIFHLSFFFFVKTVNINLLWFMSQWKAAADWTRAPCLQECLSGSGLIMTSLFSPVHFSDMHSISWLVHVFCLRCLVECWSVSCSFVLLLIIKSVDSHTVCFPVGISSNCVHALSSMENRCGSTAEPHPWFVSSSCNKLHSQQLELHCCHRT